MLEKISINNNITLKNLTISAKFIKINNFHKLIPHNLKYLKIGELDDYSLIGLFKNINFKIFKDLSCLKIVISKFLFNFDTIIESLYSFFRSKKYINLNQIYFKSNLCLNNEQLNKIYNIIDNDSVAKYIFQFSGKYIDPDKFSFRKLYTEEIDSNCTYNFLYVTEIKKYYKLKITKFIEKLAQFTKRKKEKILVLKLV